MKIWSTAIFDEKGVEIRSALFKAGRKDEAQRTVEVLTEFWEGRTSKKLTAKLFEVSIPTWEEIVELYAD